AERLTLQMCGDGENLQAVFLRQIDAFPGVCFGATIVTAAPQIQFPARLLPAIEAAFLQKLQPFVHRHVAELSADQANLMVGPLAVPVLSSLLVTHRCIFPFRRLREGITGIISDCIARFAPSQALLTKLRESGARWTA